MDKILKEAATLILNNKRSSPTFLFTSLNISYQEALNVLNELEKIDVLGPHIEGSDREILINSSKEIELIFPAAEEFLETSEIIFNDFKFCEYCGFKQSATNITCDSCFKVIGEDSSQIKGIGDGYDIKNKQNLSKSEIKNILDNNDLNKDLGNVNSESPSSFENDDKAGKNQNRVNPKDSRLNDSTNQTKDLKNSEKVDLLILLVVIVMFFSRAFWSILPEIIDDFYYTETYKIMNKFLFLIWPFIPLCLAFGVKNKSKQTILFVLGGIYLIYGLYEFVMLFIS